MSSLLAACVLALAPCSALAAYNDATLTTATVISVGGYTLNVSGSSAVIQSIVVNANSFSVTLASGSSIAVSSPSLNQLSSDVTSDVVSNTCTGSASSISLAYTGAGTVTNVITPSSAVCSGSGSAPVTTSGGGGGGNPAIIGLVSDGHGNFASSSASTTLATASTTSATGSVASVSTQTTVSTASSTYHFTRNLSLHMTGSDVKMLQQLLNPHGFPIASSGVGSRGQETTYFGMATYRALVKFQEAHASDILTPAGLSKGTGYFGKATRDFVNR